MFRITKLKNEKGLLVFLQQHECEPIFLVFMFKENLGESPWI